MTICVLNFNSKVSKNELQNFPLFPFEHWPSFVSLERRKHTNKYQNQIDRVFFLCVPSDTRRWCKVHLVRDIKGQCCSIDPFKTRQNHVKIKASSSSCTFTLKHWLTGNLNEISTDPYIIWRTNSVFSLILTTSNQRTIRLTVSKNHFVDSLDGNLYSI